MNKCGVVIGVLVGFLLSAVSLRADELDRLEADAAQKIAKQLCREVKQIKDPQVQIAPDIAAAEGVHQSADVALIVVPRRDLKEGRSEDMDAARTKMGAALGYLFAYQVVPVIDDESVATKKLRRVQFVTDEGQRAEVNCMLLAVRQVTDEDWRLIVYGVQQQPLLAVPFTESAGPGPAPVAIECKNVEGFEGDLVVTVFDKYQASFKVRYEPD